METIGVYAGTFDPITSGHMWLITEAAKMFYKFYVLVGTGEGKTPMFTQNERRNAILSAVGEIEDHDLRGRIQVLDMPKGRFTASVMRDNGWKFLVRGVRSPSDFEYEQNLRHINSDINPELTTIYMTPPKNLEVVSSSILKSMITLDGSYRFFDKKAPKDSATLLKGKCVEHILNDRVMHRTDLANLTRRIVGSYTQSRRYYHNLNHILDFVEKYEKYKSEAEAMYYRPFLLAILFHDIFYDVSRHDNEEVSAASFNSEFRGSHVDGYDFIRSTKTQSYFAEPGSLKAKASELFLDIDNSILGSDPEEYKTYSANIAKEYSTIYPRIDYLKGRKQFLISLLAKPQIFKTEVFRSMLHEKAVANMCSELKEIKKEYDGN